MQAAPLRYLPIILCGRPSLLHSPTAADRGYADFISAGAGLSGDPFPSTSLSCTAEQLSPKPLHRKVLVRRPPERGCRYSPQTQSSGEKAPPAFRGSFRPASLEGLKRSHHSIIDCLVPRLPNLGGWYLPWLFYLLRDRSCQRY